MITTINNAESARAEASHGKSSTGFKGVATRSAGLLLSAMLVLGSGPAMADSVERPGASEMIADVAIARPLGFAMTTLGAVAFVVSLPFSALGGTVKESADQLVVEPGKSVFVRCLGCRTIADKINE